MGFLRPSRPTDDRRRLRRVRVRLVEESFLQGYATIKWVKSHNVQQKFADSWGSVVLADPLPEPWEGVRFEPMAAEIEQHKKDLRGKSPEEIRRRSQSQKQGDSEQAKTLNVFADQTTDLIQT